MKPITTTQRLINGDCLNQSIARLAAIGALPNGGVKRIAYSQLAFARRGLPLDRVAVSGEGNSSTIS